MCGDCTTAEAADEGGGGEKGGGGVMGRKGLHNDAAEQLRERGQVP